MFFKNIKEKAILKNMNNVFTQMKELLCILNLLKNWTEKMGSCTENVTSTGEIFHHVSDSLTEKLLPSIGIGSADLCSVWLYCLLRNTYPFFFRFTWDLLAAPSCFFECHK